MKFFSILICLICFMDLINMERNNIHNFDINSFFNDESEVYALQVINTNKNINIKI